MKLGMTRVILLTGAVLSLGLASGCATTSQQSAPPAAEQNTAAKDAAAQAIAGAKAAYAEAEAKGYAWTTTGPLIAKAEKAFKAGDYQKATELANKAKAEAEASINQYYLAKGLANLQQLQKMKSMMNSDQLAQLKQAEQYYSESKGKPLYDLTEKLLAEMKGAKPSSYSVVKGDTLWGIAGKTDIYGNPFEWPLIYKANAAKIHDPDLIYPGQDFTINRQASQAQIDAAIHHAKTRGAWKLGEPTASDLDYLMSGPAQ
ncbi:MAG: LysM peptidoglycan-binding domain-containing protein [Acidihalobacter sp.]